MSGLKMRPCPVCGGLGRRLIHRQRFLDGPLGDGYDVVVCAHCGAGFADGIPAQGTMDRYYAERSKYAHGHPGGNASPWESRRMEATARQAAAHLQTHDARILDIGCATGGLLAAFRRLGFKNTLGTDPSQECSAEAARLHGLEVRTATIAGLRDWSERFDLILLVGVVEHIREAGDALGVVARLLAPGGLIYCAVPDVEGLADAANAPYQQFSTEHVNFFSIRSLNRLFAACGMAAVETWRWDVEWREGVVEPIASGVYRPGPADSSTPDSATEPALERYVAASRLGDAGILSTIESLRLSQEPIFVWGAGTLARRLLATTRFAEANILAFVDSDPHLVGGSLAGRPIVAWDEVAGGGQNVLICSVAFEKEIAELVRGRRGYPGRIYRILGGNPREFSTA